MKTLSPKLSSTLAELIKKAAEESKKKRKKTQK